MNSMQVKDKLKNIAVKRNLDFNTLLRLYMYDRFIERLAVSKYRDNFILKGGFYLSTLFGLESRSTKDIDTAIKNANFTKDNVEKMIKSIIAIDINDGALISFIEIGNIREEDQYGGFRVILDVKVDTIRENFQIDIATGDPITPKPIVYKYRPILGDSYVNVWSYNIETVIANNTKFEKDTTLYAKWEKIEEPKKNEPKREEPKKEEPKKEEKISLSLSNTLLHRNGTNTSKATASTENVTGNVVYSVNNNCVSINSSTGGIIANNGSESCKNGGVVTVTATTPGGKTASANLTLEKDLSLTITAGSESKTIYSNGEFATPEPSFEIIPNIDIVSWWGKCFYYNNCKYTGSRATLTRAFRGNFEQ